MEMSGIKILVIILMAVRIRFYMRCFSACIGRCRISRKIAAAAFAALWIFESFLVSISFLGQGVSVMDLFFWMVEVPFLTVMSFCYQGKAAGRILMAAILPSVYWIGKFSIGSLLFETVATESRYVIVTAISVGLFFVFGLFLEKTGRSRMERERELLEAEIRSYENQFGIIRQSQHNIRALKHDMKHHIKMLTDMVADGEREAALAYLASMGAFMENGEEYVDTGNERIDSILNHMISKAKRSGIDVSWKIRIPEHLGLPVFDINVILSNLFENALHALEDVAEPSFHISMRYDRGVLCISMRNHDPGSGKSSAPSAEHGFGLKNIERVAKKYHGSLTAESRDGDFQAVVLLFLEERDVG